MLSKNYTWGLYKKKKKNIVIKFSVIRQLSSLTIINYKHGYADNEILLPLSYRKALSEFRSGYCSRITVTL